MKLHVFCTLILLVCSLSMAACAAQEQPPRTTAASLEAAGERTDAVYDFTRPDAAFELPNVLIEVSGLTLLDEGYLGAIQDEDGKLFAIEISTGKVLGDHNFKEDEDYEGVEKVGDTVWVLRSNGTLYELNDWRAPTSKAQKHPTPLDRSCDAEGLAYDNTENHLLIACKEDPGKNLDGKRAVYAFDLASETLVAEPVYLIDAGQFEASNRVERGLRSMVKPLLDLEGFKPSGLAIHPRTGHRYVMSSVQKALVVLDADGTMLHAWGLPPSLFDQPEGITFLPNGDLFIANEGQGDAATLLRFNEKAVHEDR